MPYVITTKRPFAIGGDLEPGEVHEDVARRAVATLDEARKRAADLVDAAYDRGDPFGDGSGTDMGNALDLSDQGGTVGPLPDGTVIEVEHTDYRDLWETLPTTMTPEVDEGGHTEEGDDESVEVLAEYNARQIPPVIETPGHYNAAQ